MVNNISDNTQHNLLRLALPDRFSVNGKSSLATREYSLLDMIADQIVSVNHNSELTLLVWSQCVHS